MELMEREREGCTQQAGCEMKDANNERGGQIKTKMKAEKKHTKVTVSLAINIFFLSL